METKIQQAPIGIQPHKNTKSYVKNPSGVGGKTTRVDPKNIHYENRYYNSQVYAKLEFTINFRYNKYCGVAT